MKKVFCLGLSKTGTTSMEEALEILGYNVCHGHWKLKHNDYLLALYVNNDFEEIYKMTSYWDAFADGPWGGGQLYEKLYEWYPNAKFILTVRDPEEWYNSFIKNFSKFDTNLNKAFDAHHANHRYGSVYFFKKIMGIKTLANNKEQIINYFINHNCRVEKFLIKHDIPFLKIDITSPNTNKWKSLCNFLEIPIPNKPFPFANKALGGKISKTNTNEQKITLRNKVKNKLKFLIDKYL